MSDNSINNKRIAKNTILLYIRLLFSMCVGLFTSRIVLDTLGIDDYGVYNVVAGVVAMFSLLTGSLSNAISRYLTFELGKGDKERLKLIFSTSLNIQIVISLVVILIVEVVGIWFLNNHMNIPEDRLFAANWVMHMAIIVFALNIITVPYNASIIAHEQMSVYAYISILEVSLKLMVAYLLYISPKDKLITYSVLLAVVAFIVSFVYIIYCKNKFEECKYHFVYDKKLLKEMLGFAGWNIFGSGAYLFNTQGVNIVTNIYFNVAANAARGVVVQAESVIKQFVNNFTIAINPQITKSYATGDLPYMHSLMCKSSKFGYLLMLFFAIPFMLETEFIMSLWLKKYPPEAPLFFRLSLLGSMVDLLGNSPAVATWATGNLKKYYTWVSLVGCLVFPLSWMAFAIGMPAYSSYIIFLLVYIVVLVVKLIIVGELVNFPLMKYYNEVLVPIFKTTIVAIIVPTLMYASLNKSIITSFAVIGVGLVSVAVAVYFIGLSISERRKIYTFAESKWNTLIKKQTK